MLGTSTGGGIRVGYSSCAVHPPPSTSTVIFIFCLYMIQTTCLNIGFYLLLYNVYYLQVCYKSVGSLCVPLNKISGLDEGNKMMWEFWDSSG